MKKKPKLKVGDKVKIIKGGYKNCKGTITTIWGDIVTVEPNERADARQFHLDELVKFEW